MLPNARLDKSFWAKAIEYASHLLNRLPMSVIGGKTPLEIWSGGAACDYGSIRVFGCPAYVNVKKDMLDSKVKGYKLRDQKKRVYLKQTCHIGWGFSYEAYRLPASGDEEDQSSIVAGGGWYYSTLSSWFSIIWDSIGRDTGWRLSSRYGY